MQTYQPGDIRNFAIVGHASSGKTLLSEAMLVCGGVIHRMGSIPSSTTVSDYHESERQRKISVQASLLHTEFGRQRSREDRRRAAGARRLVRPSLPPSAGSER